MKNLIKLVDLLGLWSFHAKFDVGPHRFFTYNKEVENLYLKILDKDAIEVKRLTNTFITINYLNIRFPLLEQS